MSSPSLIVAATLTSNSTTNSSEVVSNPASFTASLLTVVAVVCVLVGIWKILQKAGENGWKAIVPFYGEYTLFKTFWERKWFWISLIPRSLSFVGVLILFLTFFYLIFSSGGALAGGILSIIGIAFVADPSAAEGIINGHDSSFSEIVSGVEGAKVTIFVWFAVLVLCLIFRFVLTIILKNKISKSFGKGAGFTVGLVLLAPVFYMILGCGKAEYRKFGENQPGEALLTNNPGENIVDNAPRDTKDF